MRRILLFVTLMLMDIVFAMPARADGFEPSDSSPYYQTVIITPDQCETSGSVSAPSPSFEEEDFVTEADSSDDCLDGSGVEPELQLSRDACPCIDQNDDLGTRNGDDEDLPGLIDGSQPLPSVTPTPSPSGKKASVPALNRVRSGATPKPAVGAPSPRPAVSPKPIIKPRPEHAVGPASAGVKILAGKNSPSPNGPENTTELSGSYQDVASTTDSPDGGDSTRTSINGALMSNTHDSPTLMLIAVGLMALAALVCVSFIIAGLRATGIRKADMKAALQDSKEKSLLKVVQTKAVPELGRHRRVAR